MLLVKLLYGNGTAPLFAAPSYHARLSAYYAEQVLKVTVGKSFYMHNNPLLDDREAELEEVNHEACTIFVCKLPRIPEYKGLIPGASKVTLSRSPMVGPNSIATFIFMGFSANTDTVEVSCRAMVTFFGDNDGDKVSVELKLTNAGRIFFKPTLRAALPAVLDGEPEESTKTGYEKFRETLNIHTSATINSEKDTSSLDISCRQIINIRMDNDLPATEKELLIMAEIKQAAVDGIKHNNANSAVFSDYLIKTFLKRLPIKGNGKDVHAMFLGGDSSSIYNRIHSFNALPVKGHPFFDILSVISGKRTKLTKVDEGKSAVEMYNRLLEIKNLIKSSKGATLPGETANIS